MMHSPIVIDTELFEANVYDTYKETGLVFTLKPKKIPFTEVTQDKMKQYAELLIDAYYHLYRKEKREEDE